MKLPPEAPEQSKDLDHLKPIDHAVIALQHTPVYKMHRYFARRPWSVFRELIEHYTSRGSVILDPFCGGGVTIFEGVRLGRKVIGVDLIPLATFITRMELTKVDLSKLRAAYQEIESLVRDRIRKFYLARCPKCSAEESAEWFEWSKVVECAECHSEVVLDTAEKIEDKPGTYRCTKPGCQAEVAAAKNHIVRDELVRVLVNCKNCRKATLRPATREDKDMLTSLDPELEEILRTHTSILPAEPFPDANMARENAVFQRGIRFFRDFFTKRNLAANALLKDAILTLSVDGDLRDALALTFSASLRFTNNMVFRNPGWQGGKPIEWAKSAYWLPDIFNELNVYVAFRNRQNAVLRGLKFANAELPSERKRAESFEELRSNATHWLLTRSSDDLPLPDDSVDDIITDPPYGGNVQYAELCDFWTVWLKEFLGAPNGLIDNTKEAITTRHSGFPTAKSLKHYREMLYRIFKECHRVLKPKRWMVMTFHNREFKIWNAIHLAAHDAGFVLAEEDGMIYQPGIKNYQQTINLRRSGSMLGDFVLSFQKSERVPQQRAIDYVEVGRQIEQLAAQAYLHHTGASGEGVTLATIYMRLIPFLLNNNLLEKIGQKEVVSYLRENFYEKDGKWFLKESPTPTLDRYLADYSQHHYGENYKHLSFIPVEARLEYLIRRLLYEKGSATQDEILNEIYTNLINSNAAEMGEINRVLSRIGTLVTPRKGGRKVWRLNEMLERETLLRAIEEKAKEVVRISAETAHDLAIRRLITIAGLEGYRAHIGKTEQKKYTEFRRLSVQIEDPRKYGLTKNGFDRVSQIDVLWLKGNSIRKAFEVEKSTTIDSGIERFRNLFAELPEAPIDAFIVIPGERETELLRKLKEPAKVRESLTKKVRYLLFEDLKIEQPNTPIQIDSLARAVA